MHVTFRDHYSWPARTALRAVRWTKGGMGGCQETWGERRRENRRRDRARSRREIGSNKPLEGTKALEREIGRAIG